MPDQNINPAEFTEASIRADRLTPEVIGRRVRVDTGEAVIVGTVTGYKVSAVVDITSRTGTILRVSSHARISIRAAGDIDVDGGAEVRVLA